MEELIKQEISGNMQEPERKIPPLNTLYFYLCGDCNLSCRHCWIAPKYQKKDTSDRYLPYDIFTDIIKQAQPLGLTGVKLTGGEPLIHPDISRILEYVRQKELILTVETNGVQVTKELAELIVSCKNPFISVSIDGIRETHDWVRGVPGAFEAVCKGTRILSDAGLRPQVIMTLMRKNYGQIEEVVSLAESLGAGSVKFNFIQPTERGKLMHERGETLSVRELIEISRWMEGELQKKFKIKIISSLPMAFRSLSSMFGQESRGCGICGIFSILGVLSDGTYALCGIGESVKELSFGTAKIDKLEEVWNRSQVLNEIRERLPIDLKEICGNCIFKNQCLGCCIAQNYYRKHDLMAPYWFCKEAEKQYLFPDSRKKIR